MHMPPVARETMIVSDREDIISTTENGSRSVCRSQRADRRRGSDLRTVLAPFEPDWIFTELCFVVLLSVDSSESSSPATHPETHIFPDSVNDTSLSSRGQKQSISPRIMQQPIRERWFWLGLGCGGGLGWRCE